MLEIVTAYIQEHDLFPTNGKVVVAVSGGADSLCLLHLLHQLCGPGKLYPNIQLHVAHLNHQLRGEASAEDADAVAHLAESWGLPLSIGCIDVPALARQEQRSLEDAARVARYRFLREVAQGQPIAVAHHMDDQVETLLLHWLRGGGIASMVGLQSRLKDIIRPLLAVTHADTVAYCQQHHLTPLEDASNADPRFLRNRIRHELVPLLASMNPGIRETLLRNAEVMRVDTEWIEAQVDNYWATIVLGKEHDRIRLRRSSFLVLPLSLQRHLVRRVTAQLSAGQSPLALRHYKLLEQLVQRESTGEELTLHLPDQLHVTSQNDVITFLYVDKHTLPQADLVESIEAALPVPGEVRVPGASWIAKAEIVPDERLQRVKVALQGQDWATVWQLLPSTRCKVYIDGDSIGQRDVYPSLRVRTRRAGDRIQPLGMAYEKKVQDVLVDNHISRAERSQIPLFFAQSHCVWLAGVRLDERVRLTSQTQRIVCLSIIPI